MSAQPAAVTLEEVPGPSALGGGWRRFFDLLWLISLNEFKKTYYGTVFGYLWSLIRPLALFGVLLFVFTRVLGLGNSVPDYPVLLLLNLQLFTFFQEATQASVTAVLNNEGIVRKTQFPRLVIPLSSVLTAALNLLFNLVAVFGFILVYGVGPYATWLLLPVLLVPLACFTAALALILSSLYVRYRDVAIIWSVAVTALFYGTPVLYAFKLVPKEFHSVLQLNPLVPLFNQARKWFITPDAGGAAFWAGGYSHLLPALAVFVAVCGLSVWVFGREAPRVAEAL